MLTHIVLWFVLLNFYKEFRFLQDCLTKQQSPAINFEPQPGKLWAACLFHQQLFHSILTTRATARFTRIINIKLTNCSSNTSY